MYFDALLILTKLNLVVIYLHRNDRGDLQKKEKRQRERERMGEHTRVAWITTRYHESFICISKERHANLSQFKQVSWTLLQLINNTKRRWRAGHAYFF